MNFATEPLCRGVIRRMAKRNHEIENIFAPRCSALLSALPSMMNKDNSNSLLPQPQSPFLYGQPGLPLIFFTGPTKRAQIVQDEEFGVLQETFDSTLPLARC